MTSLLLAAVLAAPTVEPATVTIEPRTVRSIGGVTELDRRQFLTIHATPGDGDITDDEHRWLNEHLQVSYGRDGGYQSWMMTTIPADPSNPDMPDVAFMAEAGAEAVRERQSSPRYTPQFWRDVILCTHPETTVARPDNTHTTWGPRTIDAAAEFTAQFLRHYYDDQTRPTHIEVFNEPFIKIRSLGSSVQAMSQQHITTARRIRELNPDVQVGGYSAAWMEVEARDFAHWNGWMKTFIDIAGAEMDFLSYHVYDGSNAGGADANRTGSNSEALLDLMTTYPRIVLGEEKPLLITEHGRITNGGPGDSRGPYNPRRVAQLIGSVNSQVMTFMDHPDRLERTIPFLLTRAMWSYQNEDFESPYTFLTWRQAGNNSVLTEVPLWYEFWRDVGGEYRWATADDPDVRVQVWADDMRLTVALANLESNPREVRLAGLDDLDIARIRVRSLRTHGDIAAFDESTLLELPETMQLAPSEGAILLIDLRDSVGANTLLTQDRHYADDYLHPITADQPITTTITDVPADSAGGVLRLSIGRTKDLSLTPTVTFNGTELTAPTDWAGDEQTGRTEFFGMLEFPVPAEAINGNAAEVVVTFPDTGGHLATVVFQSHTREPVVAVDVELDMRHEIGGIDELDRAKFLAVHADPYEDEWRGEIDKLDYFVNDLDSHFGRETGKITNTLLNSREDPARPGFADPAHIREMGTEDKAEWNGRDEVHPLAMGQDVIVCAQLHPFWPGGTHAVREGWTLSTTDTQSEPIGTATGTFVADYFDAFFGDDARAKPKYFEIINEPLYYLTTHGETDPADVFRFHSTVADIMDERHPDVLVGGYVTAFVIPEADDFGRWNNRWKSFIDIAGEDMDYWSVHFYDFPGISGGKVQLRRGSNTEAVFDLIDHYSTLKLGQPKPYLISEYGSQLHDWYHQPWSPVHDAHVVKAGTAMLMQFMERPDLMHKTILFAMPKAEWGRESDEVPYLWRLMRRANEGDANLSDDTTGDWVWTDNIKFFELWSDVRGTRVNIASNDPDIQVQSFVDGDTAYVVLNSLDDAGPNTVRLDVDGGGDGGVSGVVESVTLKLLDFPNDVSRLETRELDHAPDTVELPANATAILTYTFAEPIEIEATASERKYFADTYLQRITADQPTTFVIKGVELADAGEATLRLGIGRDHGSATRPSLITVNGQSIAIPTDFRGDDTQTDRERFFGLLEIPVPLDLLNKVNEIIVSYPDDGGHTASVALRVVSFDRPVKRSFD